MNVNVAGHLYKRKIVKDLAGNIIDLFDEADGGWIIKSRQVVNKEKWEQIKKIEQDKIEAAKTSAQAMANPESFQNPEAPDRNFQPTKMEDLEKKVAGLEDKLDLIIKALEK